MPRNSIKIVLRDRTVIMFSGDTLDFGPDGLIEWYPEPVAEAMRTLRRDHQSNVRSAMRHQAKSVYEVLAAELGPIIGTKQWKATLKTIKEKLGDQSH